MILAPGNKSTEYAKALRAEVAGGLAFVSGVGAALCFEQPDRALIGLGLAALGALLVASANGAYAASRGGAKAAALRRPSDTGTRHI